jgi:hypothetical protein
VEAQGVQVVVVGTARVGDGDGLEPGRGFGDCLGGDGVFGIQHQSVQVGQHPEHRLAGALFQPVQSRFEQADVAAEAVDDEAPYPRLFACRKQGQGADEMGEDAAAVDVGDQDHGHVGRFGEAHVGDVAVAQVDLGRAAGTFDQDAVEFRRESRPAIHHCAHRDALVFVVIAGIQGIHRPAVDDHLGTLVGGRLEQHRVEVDARREAGRQRLQGLGATDLAAVGGYRRVERHVLRFERIGNPMGFRGVWLTPGAAVNRRLRSGMCRD